MDDLRRVAEECATRWSLVLEEPLESEASLVIPAGDAVLKVNADWHFEAEFEVDALTLYEGRGAVRLLARDDERRALLMERCRPGTRSQWSPSSCRASLCGSRGRIPFAPSRTRPTAGCTSYRSGTRRRSCWT